MHLLDFFFLAFALIVLAAMAAARMSGKLPDRGLYRRTAPGHSMLQGPRAAPETARSSRRPRAEKNPVLRQQRRGPSENGLAPTPKQ